MVKARGKADNIVVKVDGVLQFVRLWVRVKKRLIEDAWNEFLYPVLEIGY